MDRFALVQTIAPAVEPLTLAEAKLWCRVDTGDTSQDDAIAALIAAARQRCERVAMIALVTQTWRLTLDHWPGTYDGIDVAAVNSLSGWYAADDDPRVIRVPRPPLQSVTIAYSDTTDATVTLAATEYQVDADGACGRILPAYGKYWPVTRPKANAVVVTFVAGYGLAAAVPEDVKTALRIAVAYMNENREQIDDVYLDSLFLPFRVAGYFG